MRGGCPEGASALLGQWFGEVEVRGSVGQRSVSESVVWTSGPTTSTWKSDIQALPSPMRRTPKAIRLRLGGNVENHFVALPVRRSADRASRHVVEGHRPGATWPIDSHPESDPVLDAPAFQRSGEADALVKEALSRECLHERAEPVGPRDHAPQLSYGFSLTRHRLCERMLVLPAVTACHVPSRHWHVSCVWLALGSWPATRRSCARASCKVRLTVPSLTSSRTAMARSEDLRSSEGRRLGPGAQEADRARIFEESSRARIGWRREAVRGVKRSLRSRATKPDVSTPSNALTMRRCDDRHALRHDLGGDRARGSHGHRDAQRTTSATP